MIITPCKNEERNLPKLIKSLNKQTKKPNLWIIVDDGSTDSTPVIINSAKREHAWIESIRLESNHRDLGLHVYCVYNEGFTFLQAYCKIHNIPYEYIGNIDADMILEETNFFERLIAEFEGDRSLGIVSSRVYSVSKDKLIVENDKTNLPMGSPRIWRKECFEQTGGYPISYSADSVSNVIARLKGWKLKTVEEVSAIQLRRTSSAEGMWKGYLINGKSAHFRNYHPLFVVLKGVRLCFVNPYYIGIAYIYGYFVSVLNRQDKFNNKEVTDYYYKNKFKESLSYYLRKTKNRE